VSVLNAGPPGSLIVSAPFPNVPNLSGVPQLARSQQFPPSPSPTLGAQSQAPLLQSTKTLVQWGIYDAAGTVLVLAPDSFLAFDKRNEWRISDYPIQQGSFASYNKVIVPFELSLRVSKGGSLTDRENFLTQLDAISGDTNLYTVITPEKTYTNVNISRTEVTRRGPQGAYFLAEVDIFFRQILQVTAQYSSTTTNTANAQNPAAQPATNLGNTQPGQVPPSAVPKITAAVAAQGE
jgi:hypothetical protein